MSRILISKWSIILNVKNVDATFRRFSRNAKHRRQPTFRSDVTVAADVIDDEDADAEASARALGWVGAEAPREEVDQ